MIGPLCGTMGRINKQQIGPLYRSRRFQDTIHVNFPSFVSSESESVFLPRYHEKISRNFSRNGQWKGYKIRELPVLFPVISFSKKERKATSGNRFFSAKSIYKETTIQDGDNQFGMTVDIGQRLDCLHRPDRCLPTCSDSTSIQKVSSVHVRRSGLPIHGLALCPKAHGFSPNW